MYRGIFAQNLSGAPCANTQGDTQNVSTDSIKRQDEWRWKLCRNEPGQYVRKPSKGAMKNNFKIMQVN